MAAHSPGRLASTHDATEQPSSRVANDVTAPLAQTPSPRGTACSVSSARGICYAQSRMDESRSPGHLRTTKTILVIEDEGQMRRNIRLLIEMEGFGRHRGRKRTPGSRTSRGGQPDLILCDMMMPDLDGEGVLETLRRDVRTAAIPFLFLSARSHTAFARRDMVLPVEDCLAKPISTDELSRAIRPRLAAPPSFPSPNGTNRPQPRP